MQRRAARRVNLITVKGQVVTDNYISSNIGWLRVMWANDHKDSSYFVLQKSGSVYVVKYSF